MTAREAPQSRSPYGVLIAAVFAVLLLLFVYSVAEVLLLVFLSTLFSLFLGAISQFLEDRFHFPRWLGILSALLFTGVLATGIGFLIVPPVLAQTQALIGDLPAQVAVWMQGLRDLATRYPFLAALLAPDEINRQLQEFTGLAGSYFAGLFPYLFNGLHAVINVISVAVMGIYMAARPDTYREGMVGLAPPVHRELVRDILADLGRSLRAWIGGQIIAMFFLGFLTWIGLEILGVPFALAFGVFTGVAVMVPFFGTLVSTLLPAFFVLGSGGLLQALLVVLLGVVIHVIEANFVHPLIMERRVHIPPVLSILSVLVMAELLGVIGLLVAVPILASLMVIVRRIYVHRLLEGKGFRRFVRDAPTEIRLPEGVARLDGGGVSIPGILEEAGAAPR
ncbi:MAG TPA: AI-2E family transporter [Longimicrobiaceae bacterium]|nr:AI-2E family transporter [Longimicrobiaceae bacterium]